MRTKLPENGDSGSDILQHMPGACRIGKRCHGGVTLVLTVHRDTTGLGKTDILHLPLELFNETPCQSGAAFSPTNKGCLRVICSFLVICCWTLAELPSQVSGRNDSFFQKAQERVG